MNEIWLCVLNDYNATELAQPQLTLDTAAEIAAYTRLFLRRRDGNLTLALNNSTTSLEFLVSAHGCPCFTLWVSLFMSKLVNDEMVY
jgi:hypothetical protein